MTTTARPESTSASTPASPASTPAAPADGGSSGSSTPASTPTPVSSSGARISPRVESEFWEGGDNPEKADPFSSAPVEDPFADDEAAPAATEGGEAAPETPLGEPEGATTPAETTEPEVVPIPFKYQVDGQEVAFDGIEEIPGEGALVSLDALPRLRDRLQMADRLGPQVQQYQQTLNRFQQVGGFERMEQLEANAAVLQAVGAKFLEILAEDGPKTEEGYAASLAELATDPRARALMLRELDVITRDAELKARGTFKGQMAGVEQAGQQEAARSGAIKGAVSEMAAAVAKNFGVTLDPSDVAEAEQVFSQFADSIYRPATAEEAAALRVPVGSPIIDYPKMHPWFVARAQFRQRGSADATRATAAATENANRLAAATPTRPANTRAATQRPGTGTKTPARPDRPEITDWKMRMRLGLSPIVDATPANP